MKIRILSAVIGICLLVPVLWFSGTIVFPIALSVLAALAAWELCCGFGLKGKWFITVPAVAYAVLAPIMTEFVGATVKGYLAFLALLSYAFFFLILMISVFRSGKEPFSLIARVSIAVIYTTIGFTSLALIRRLSGGAYLLGLVFVGAWVTDTMAYFTGLICGKHKLCPNISPKKTVEGSIGGTFFCALAFVLYGLIVNKIVGVEPNYVMLLIGGLVVSVVAQIGDLAASLIKREQGIKDFGKIMPGHGGVMDRFDSMLSVAPLLLVLYGFASAFAFFS